MVAAPKAGALQAVGNLAVTAAAAPLPALVERPMEDTARLPEAAVESVGVDNHGATDAPLAVVAAAADVAAVPAAPASAAAAAPASAAAAPTLVPAAVASTAAPTTAVGVMPDGGGGGGAGYTWRRLLPTPADAIALLALEGGASVQTLPPGLFDMDSAT